MLSEDAFSRNVPIVSPASIVERVGADTARCYILFVGPLDLSHALGLPVGSDHPELLKQVRTVVEAAWTHDGHDHRDSVEVDTFDDAQIVARQIADGLAAGRPPDLARANLIFGLHVHVGIPNRESAIHVMNQARYFLPHIYALSANSPFWIGRDTGLKGYRLKVFERFPRTGIPDAFESLS